MLKIENSLLRRRINQLSVQLAFSRLKLLSPPNKNPPSEPTSLTNKALYLQYIEQVLQNKENDLIKLQKQLSERQNKIEEQGYKKGVKVILGEMEVIKILDKKLKAMQEKMGIRSEQYMALFKRFQAQSAKSKNEMEEMFKKQYNDLIDQRRLLRNKLSQFAQLESYEKYLNELHSALSAKSQQLIQRESMLSHGQQQLYQQMQELETNSKHTNPSNYSNRKRIKIFNTKLHPLDQINESVSREKYASNMKNNMKLNLHLNSSPRQLNFNNQTFSKWEQAHNSKNMHSHNTRQEILLLDDTQSLRKKDYGHFDVNQSSAILAENSREDTRQGLQDFQTNPRVQRVYAHDYQTQSKDSENKTCDSSVQVDSQTISEAGERLRKQGVLLKFARKWMKHSFDNSKATIAKKKLMAVNLWKMNAFFDEDISHSAIYSIQSLQKVWRKQQRILYSSRMFPYNELSLKRKKYAELMFDLEQKVFHRKRVQKVLRSILTQKHRKERLIFYLYFCKFIKNSCNNIKATRELRDKLKFGQTGGTISGSGLNTQSRTQLISMNSSHILNQQKILLPNKKSSPHLAPSTSKSPLKSQPLSKQTSNQRFSQVSHQNKENNTGFSKKQTEQNPKQTQKLQTLISEKQRTQRLLATQCVRLEGLIKMCVILTQCTFKTNNWAMKRLREGQYEEKIQTLASQLDGLQFRFDLVMTKCKLGLANNSNKISTLENLLDFSNILK